MRGAPRESAVPDLRARPGVARGREDALHREEARACVDHVVLQQDPGAHRVGADQATVAGDHPGVGADLLAPDRAAILEGYAADGAVVGPEVDPRARHHRRVADRTVTDHPPEEAAVLGVEADHFILARRAEQDPATRDDRVGGFVIGDARFDLREPLPVTLAGWRGPGWRGRRGVVAPTKPERFGQRLGGVGGPAGVSPVAWPVLAGTLTGRHPGRRQDGHRGGPAGELRETREIHGCQHS